MGQERERPLLLTGFGPFEGVPDNPTAAIVGALEGGQLGDTPILGLVVPVSYRRARHVLDSVLVRHRPRARLHLGVATRRRTLSLERVARLGMYSESPDIDGHVPSSREAAIAQTTDVNTSAVLRSLQEADVPARVSRDAGRYLCNALYGWSLAAGPAVPTLFVHVPPVGARRTDRGTWSLEALTRAVSVVSQSLIAQT